VCCFGFFLTRRISPFFCFPRSRSHTDCVIPWLAKKEEHQCPVCRQQFCATAIVDPNESTAGADHSFSHENSFLESFSQAFALSQFYRSQDGTSNQDLDAAARQASHLELRNLALRHHMLRASVMRDAEERAAARREEANRRQMELEAVAANEDDAPAGNDVEEGRTEESSAVQVVAVGDNSERTSGDGVADDDEPESISRDVERGTNDDAA